MTDSVDDLLKQYALGKLMRREVLAAITLLLTPTESSAQDGVLKGRSLNHLNIRVTDAARSEAFYRKLLGFGPARPVDGGGSSLELPNDSSITLCPLSLTTCRVKRGDAQPGDIDHFAIHVDDFNADRVTARLNDAGFDAVFGSGHSVYVVDPDGAIIQLSAIGETYPVVK
jgi:catechol 2,3-dioxygenase-like lactoylglutathione lyase family enzyme